MEIGLSSMDSGKSQCKPGRSLSFVGRQGLPAALTRHHEHLIRYDIRLAVAPDPPLQIDSTSHFLDRPHGSDDNFWFHWRCLRAAHPRTAPSFTGLAPRRQNRYAGAPTNTIPNPIAARTVCETMVLATNAIAAAMKIAGVHG